MNGWNIFSGIIAVASGAIAGYSLHEVRKMHKERDSLELMLTTKLNMAIDDVSNRDEIDIADAIIEAGVNKAADRMVNVYANHGARDIRKEVLADMRGEADKAIKDLKEDFKPEVEKALKDRAAKITVNDIKKEVIGDISEDLKKQMDKEVAEIVRKQNDRLDDLNKIYDNINASLKPRKED